MNHSTLRANQHAEKWVDFAWLPMRVSKRDMWEELEWPCGLDEEGVMVSRDGEYCFSYLSRFVLIVHIFLKVSVIDHLVF